jgi:predicted secreted protein
MKSINLYNDTNTNELEIIYKINAGIPFRWDFEVADKDIVEFVKKEVVRNDNVGAICGAPVYTKYVFKGLKKGKTNIIFKYVYFDDESVRIKDNYSVVVDDNLDIKIVNTKNSNYN